MGHLIRYFLYTAYLLSALNVHICRRSPDLWLLTVSMTCWYLCCCHSPSALRCSVQMHTMVGGSSVHLHSDSAWSDCCTDLGTLPQTSHSHLQSPDKEVEKKTHALLYIGKGPSAAWSHLRKFNIFSWMSAETHMQTWQLATVAVSSYTAGYFPFPPYITIHMTYLMIQRCFVLLSLLLSFYLSLHTHTHTHTHTHAHTICMVKIYITPQGEMSSMDKFSSRLERKCISAHRISLPEE